jgi:AraC-like DNA-binding protein
MQIIINLHNEPMRTGEPGGGSQGESINSAIFAGARLDFLVIDTRSIVSCLGIVFKPGGAAPFFGLPMTELKSQCISLDVFWGSETDRLRDQLLESQTPRQCFHRLEWFLVQKLANACDKVRANQPFVWRTVDALTQLPGETSLASLRERCGYGTTRFTSLFSQAVGLTPKEFSRVLRFQHVLNTLFRKRNADWTEIALRFGYYDQSHFIHEFKTFTGITPGNYFTKRIEGLNHLAL